MTIFDQRGQNVNQQFNVSGDIGEINFESVQNRQDVISQLRKIQEKINKSVDGKILDEETAIEVEYKIKKAIQQAKKEKPDKKTIVNYLDEAKNLIAGVTSAASLVTALKQAIVAVLAFF